MSRIKDKNVIQALKDLELHEDDVFPIFTYTPGKFGQEFVRISEEVLKVNTALMAAHKSWKSQQAALVALAELDL